MKINISKLLPDLRQATAEVLKQLNITVQETGYFLEAKRGDNFLVSFDGKTFHIEYPAHHMYFRALQLIRRFGDKEFSISERCMAKEFGVMLDCSRNAVRTVNFLKNFIQLIACMGYNQLYLYMEDTYEIVDEPFFGYMRGRYTPQELKEVDTYAQNYGIEVIPCIQTLAHLNQIFRWKEYQSCHDIKDILLIDEDRTYELIEKMISTISQCFSSSKIHLGMDEARYAGRGKYEDIHGYSNCKEILQKHLQRVLNIAEQYDLQPMIWSDMYYRLAYDGFYGEEQSNKCLLDNDIIPQGLRVVYWDYNGRKRYDRVMQNHLKMGGETAFAGGAWSWLGFTPHNYFSIEESRLALQTCEKYQVDKIMFTLWGDCGAECSPLALLPTLFANAEYCYGNKCGYEKYFQYFIGIDFETFMCLDLPDRIVPNVIENVNNPSKYMLYNDFLGGMYDWIADESNEGNLKRNSLLLKKAKAKGKQYRYLFETQYWLNEVLVIKYCLGVKVRKAYETNDKVAMEEILKEYSVLIKKINQFYQAFTAQWERESKPFGFEVQDYRLGGLCARAKHVQKRLQAWIQGNTKIIPELEETMLMPFGELADQEDFTACQVFFEQIFSANLM